MKIISKKNCTKTINQGTKTREKHIKQDNKNILKNTKKGGNIISTSGSQNTDGLVEQTPFRTHRKRH